MWKVPTVSESCIRATVDSWPELTASVNLPSSDCELERRVSFELTVPEAAAAPAEAPAPGLGLAGRLGLGLVLGLLVTAVGAA